MSTPDDAIAAGLPPSNRQILDFNQAPVIKRAQSPADRALTKDAAAAYQRGELNVGPRTSFEGEIGTISTTPTPAVLSPPAHQNLQTIQPAPQPALPLPTGPELRPTDPPRFQERINALWRQKSEAEERAEAVERRLAELTQRLDSRFVPQSQAFTNQYASSPNYSPPSSTPTFESDNQTPPPAGQSKIGRASCRERVYNAGL